MHEFLSQKSLTPRLDAGIREHGKAEAGGPFAVTGYLRASFALKETRWLTRRPVRVLRGVELK